MFLPNQQKVELGEQGYSFVELLITMVIIGVVLVPQFSLFDFSSRIQVLGQQELIALNLAQSRMEELLNEYCINGYRLLAPLNSISDMAVDGQIYQIYSNIAVPRGMVQELSVEVIYETLGQAKNVRLTTRVVEYP